MDKLNFREQLLKQDGLTQGYAPTACLAKIHIKACRQRVLRGLTKIAMATFIAVGMVLAALPGLLGRSPTQTRPRPMDLGPNNHYHLGFTPNTRPLDPLYYWAGFCLGLGLFLLLAMLWRKWSLRRRLKTVAASGLHPEFLLSSLAGRK